MHDCLRIAELAELICCQFDSSSRARDRRALAAVATTCTALKDPALNRLWRTTPLARLLTSCMPPDLWRVADPEGLSDAGKPRTLTLCRPICESDWGRVHLYAPRIRELRSGSVVLGDTLLGDTLPTVSRAFPRSLLHDLRDLLWEGDSDSLRYLVFFLRPSMTKISFELQSTADCAVFPTLGEICPELCDISITAGCELGEAVIGRLSDFVAHLPLVETISVPSLRRDAVEHLSTLPTLKSLQMFRVPGALDVLPVLAGPAFLALRHLCLRAPTPADISWLLPASTDVPLETLYVALDVVPPAADVHTLFTTIGASVSASTLTRLHLGCRTFGWGDPRSHLIHPGTLVLLLCFENLTELTLASSIGFDLDDETVSQMARAWPRMESLHLLGFSTYTRPRTTLASLSAIARHCPRMYALTIAFDGSAIPPSTAVSLGVAGQHNSLFLLNVLHSPIAAVRHMQQYLFGVFPNLLQIYVVALIPAYEDSLLRLRRWQEVSAAYSLAEYTTVCGTTTFGRSVILGIASTTYCQGMRTIQFFGQCHAIALKLLHFEDRLRKELY
ncbi:hypothetical protein C8R47DRAFT_1068017 [Mycena vitilis]|nr:hypothetical protein C8R47DRAFT_1068017 [Mycena vitilis]